MTQTPNPLSVTADINSTDSNNRDLLPTREENFNTPKSAGKQEAISDGSQDENMNEDSDVDIVSSSSDSDYLSFEDNEDGDDDDVEHIEAERMARERERQMVLEAAGLIVKTVEGVKRPNARLVRNRSVKSQHGRPDSPTAVPSAHKRRTPPAAPVRRKPKRMFSKDKDLPPIPIHADTEQHSSKPLDPVVQLDDAYARYESFKIHQMENVNTNRLSVISTDSTRSTSPTTGSFTIINPPSPMSTSPVPSQNRLSTVSSSSKDTAGSKDKDGSEQTPHRSHFRNYFSLNRAPEPDAGSSSLKKLVISGPMALGSVTTVPRSGASISSSRNSLHGSLGSPSSPRSTHFQAMGAVSPMASSNNLAIGPPMSAASTIVPGQDSPVREPSPTFGTSWASLVDKTALEGIPTNERKRQEAIFELINTEVAYVRDLQLIVEVFYSTMLDILSHKEITVVFANIEDILLTNTAFLSSLEERQKDCRLYIDKIGDILLSHFPNMGVYLEYCVNQQTANKVLQSLKQSKPALVDHMKKLKDNPATRNLDLPSYLLEPMQRITRYPLLIKQIAHYTSASDSPDVDESNDIARAKELSEQLLDAINETIRDQEGKETLKKLSEGGLWIGQGRLDLTAPTRYMGPRKLLKQGVLAKAKSGRKLKAFLCSDILVLTDSAGRNLYRMPIPLAHTQVKEVVGTLRDESTFQVIQAYPRGGDTIALKANSQKDLREWIKQVELASRRCRHAEEKAVRKGFA